jgi:hypothetical protein
VNDPDKLLTFSDGINFISEDSAFFPFISSNKNIFPLTGNFYIKVKYKYLEITDYGVGFGFGNITPVYGLKYYPFKDSDFVKFQLWQGKNENMNIETRECDSADVCKNIRTCVLNDKPNLDEHTIMIKNYDGVTYVYLDDILTQSSPLTNTHWRPTVFWMGNLIQLDSKKDWSDIKIMSVETGILEESTSIIKSIIIPGLVASWDLGAILTGVD